MFIDALIEASNQQAPAKAIVTAYQRALRSVPIEPAEAQRLARLATVHAVREILAEAARNLTGSSELCDELTRVATALRDAMRELPSSKSRDDSALTSRASKASDELRRGAFVLPADPAAAVFLGVSRKQLALSIESLTNAAQASEQARVAVMATLNGVRGEARWVEAPVWVRRALVRDAVASAAASLGSSALDEGTTNQSAIDAATALLTSIDQVDSWIPERGRPTTAGPRTPLRNEARKMSDSKNPVIQTLQDDATDAAWRLAGSQFLKAAREPLVGLLQRHLGPDDSALRARIATFLETPVGAAVLGSVLSVGLTALPGSMGPAPARLARELRVKAMTDAGELVADVLMGPLRQVIATYLQGVPMGNEPQIVAAPTVRAEVTQGTPPATMPVSTEQNATVSKPDSSG